MRKLLFAAVCVLAGACSNNINMLLPRGPEGPPGNDGKSAYQIWVEEVESGAIDWDEETDKPGFFRYLKGEKGDPGIDGKSAYDQWVDDVKSAEGLDNPHDGGTALWPADQTEMHDFYRYLMGEDGAPGKDGNPGSSGGGQGAAGPAGKSAYELWADEVKNGSMDNPKTPGDTDDTWPEDRFGTTDFYEYLRGADGADGNQGIPGLSAYDEWKKLVDDGTVPWDEGTEPDDFMRFLKGKEGEPGEDGKPGIDGVDGLDGAAGENGTDGIDGIDGRSAYAIWVDAVAAGIADPHNPGSNWPADKTDMNDFYRYMTGKDGAAGISAYGLWVLDVRKGIIENPHAPGMWPDDQTTLMDFWHYLRGEDGEDGETPAPIVVPGQPGADVPPVGGMPNVIALYKDQAHSEYVSTADGSVLYQVWLADGNKAGAGVEVSDMPGPGMEGKTFTTYDDGTFKVPADKLPTSGTTAERYGTATVNGVESAPNTYVPQKIKVRLMIGNSSTLMPELVTASTNELNGGAYMSVPIKAQRKVTNEGEWEDLPVYMTGINRTVRAYEVTPATIASGKTTPNMNVMLKHRSDAAQDLRGATVSVRRPTMPVDWMTPEVQKERYYMLQPDSDKPDYTPAFFTMVLDDDTGFYGENPHTSAIIETAPVNFHPLPSALTMSIESATSLRWRSVTFDVRPGITPDPYEPYTLSIYTDLLFVARYTSQESTNPNIDPPVTFYFRGNDANDNKCFAVNFSTGNTLSGGTNQASVGDPSYPFASPQPVVLVGSYVYLKPSSILIAGPGNATPIGKLIEKPGSPGEYIIRAEAPFTFADIPITIQP